MLIYYNADQIVEKLEKGETIESWGLLGIHRTDIVAKIIPKLIELLKDPRERVRAVKILGLLGAEADSVIPQLVLLLNDYNPYVLSAVAFTLGEIGKCHRSLIIPPLTPLLKDQNTDVFDSALCALAKMGAGAAIPYLISKLTDGDKETRSKAVYRLGIMGARAKSVVSHLIPLLNDHDIEVQKQTALAIGKISPGDESIIPSLIPLLKHGDEDMRSKAAYAIGAKLSSIPWKERQP
jgi:HEAT repeat protein